ncbi:MAG: GNAT family N-acetyltransferase [Chloroflexi bacterium]|nr:MAG: GNAT family N-acetyltransferase [Chloroflexota bacterium]
MTNQTGLRVRPAGLADARAIAALHADSWRRHYSGAYSDLFLDGDVGADRSQVWTTRLGATDGKAATFVAEDEEALLGFIHVALDDDPAWGSLVDNLHVIYDRKRQRIGRRLMGEAARAVVEHGPGGLYLWVLEQNVNAQAFYEELGARCVERALAAAPRGDPAHLNGMPAKLRYAWPEPAGLLQRQ